MQQLESFALTASVVIVVVVCGSDDDRDVGQSLAQLRNALARVQVSTDQRSSWRVVFQLAS